MNYPKLIFDGLNFRFSVRLETIAGWQPHAEIIVRARNHEFAENAFVNAGIRIVAVHKGLLPPSNEEHFPHLTSYAKTCRQGGQGLAAA